MAGVVCVIYKYYEHQQQFRYLRVAALISLELL